MKLYQTRKFKSNYTNEEKSAIIYCVFSDSERDNIRTLQQALIQLKDELKQNKQLKRWTKNDDEALYEILEWPQHYEHGGKMVDLSEDQIDKIMKMIRKLTDDEITFFDLCNITLDRGVDPEDIDTYMTDFDMRREMDRRRLIDNRSTRNTYNNLFE